MTDFLVLAGGNMICVGYAQGKFCMVKHNSQGDIISTRMLPEGNASSLAKIKWESSSTLLIVGSNGKDLYRTDTSCNVLLSKHLIDNNGNPNHCYDIQALPNGDKIVLYTQGFTSLFVARLSGDLSMVRWSRFITGTDYSIESIFQDILVDGDKLILAGTSVSMYGWYYYGTILQLNVLSGNLEKSKRYRIDLSNADASQLVLGKIIKYNNGYIVKATFRSSSEIPITDILGYVKFDTALNITTVKSFQNINNTVAQSQATYDLYAEPDGSIFGAHGSSNHNMFHINANDSLLWTRRLDGWLGYVLAIKKTSDGFVGFGNANFNLVGVGYFGYYYLLKSTANGELPGCDPYPDQLTLRSLPFSEITNVTALVDSTNIQTESFTGNPFSGQFDMSATCDKVSTCNSIKIVGDVAHCSTLPATFKGRRNRDCKLPVTFSVSPANGVTVQSLTDSSSAITFSADGTYLIRSILQTGCGDFYDSMVVKVQRAAPLQLGPDTLLCNNSNIKLEAQPGYQSYLWNKQYTDSIISIDNPGVYSVKVQDFCKGVYYDTVVVNPAPAFPFAAGADHTICNGESVSLAATAGFMNYQWYPNYKSSSINTGNNIVSPNVDTFYVVTAEKWPGCVVQDTVSITVKPIPIINLGPDTSFCDNNSLLLNAPASFTGYAWNTGSTSPGITVHTAGTYSVIATAANGCSAADTLVVSEIYSPAINLGNDFYLCSGDNKLLDAGRFSAYAWQDGSVNQQYTVSHVGVYWVTVTDNNHCTASDTVRVTSLLTLPQNFLPPADSLCEYGKVSLHAAAAFKTYLWSNGSTQPSIEVDRPGVYTLSVSDAWGCKGTDTIRVVPKDCMQGVYIPTAFTPNNDGSNDVFRVMVYESVISFQLNIYNRFGQLVFSNTDPTKGWNGTFNGIPQNAGAFVYQCVYQLQGGKPVMEKGTVLLIR